MFDPSDVDNAIEPIAMRGYQTPTQLVRLFRTYFQTNYKKIVPSLDRLVWSAIEGPESLAQNAGSIEIMRLGEARSEITDLPKILIRREAVADQTVGIADGQRSAPIAQPIYETVSVCSVTIFAMSRVLDESDLLGFEIFEFLRHFRRKIRRQLKLKRMKVNQIGAVGILRDFPDFFATPVSLDYAYFDNPRVLIERFPIRELNIKTE